MIELSQINPLANRIFAKQNIRQVIREWSVIDEVNIEYYERIFMHSLYKFINWNSPISEACYKKILNGKEDKLTETYIKDLQEGVKILFLDEEHKFSKFEYEEYLCLETIEDLFFYGEVYKFVKKRFERDGTIGTHGCLENLGGERIKTTDLHLIPQKGNKHLIIPQEWKLKFKKL